MMADKLEEAVERARRKAERDRLAARITALEDALEPFAACMEYIADDEDDE